MCLPHKIPLPVGAPVSMGLYLKEESTTFIYSISEELHKTQLKQRTNSNN
jgi:hypothetical protein